MLPLPSSGERIATLEAKVATLEKALLLRGPDGHQTIKEAIGVIRDYALGDLVMLAPSLKALKEKNPTRPLVLVTHTSLLDVLDGADYLDAILPKNGYGNADFYQKFDVCSAVEVEGPGKLSVAEYRSMPRPDLFAKHLGVEEGATEFPVPVDPRALRNMGALLSGRKHPIIGLAATCQSPVRTMPPEYIEPLAKLLAEKYKGTVVIFGKTKNWNKYLVNIKIPDVVNLIDHSTIKELIAIISLMDAIISPDTGTMHVAGALKVKCLAVMGNNNPKHFADFYSSVKVLQPSKEELPCVPCEDISHSCLPLSVGSFGAPCMRVMTPERINGAFQEFYSG